MYITESAIEDEREREYEIAHCRECLLRDKRSLKPALCDKHRPSKINKEVFNKVMDDLLKNTQRS